MPGLLLFAKLFLFIFLITIASDYFILFITGRKPLAKRIVSARLSNGDKNEILLIIKNNFLENNYRETI